MKMVFDMDEGVDNLSAESGFDDLMMIIITLEDWF